MWQKGRPPTHPRPRFNLTKQFRMKGPPSSSRGGWRCGGVGGGGCWVFSAFFFFAAPCDSLIARACRLLANTTFGPVSASPALVRGTLKRKAEAGREQSPGARPSVRPNRRTGSPPPNPIGLHSCVSRAARCGFAQTCFIPTSRSRTFIPAGTVPRPSFERCNVSGILGQTAGTSPVRAGRQRPNA